MLRFYLHRNYHLLLSISKLIPTTVISSFPSPVKILVPDIITHEGTSCLPAVFLDPSAISSSLF